MDKQFIITRQGKEFVLYAGLLHEAHQNGLASIATNLLQVPHPDNDNTAIAHATVTTAHGIYQGIGDANAGNVSKMMVPHIIRMAETRAKARALRDALDIGAAALEELGDDTETDADHRPAPQRPLSPPREPTPITRAAPRRPPSSGAGGRRPTPQQLATIARLCGQLGDPLDPTSITTYEEAAQLIADLQTTLHAI